MTRRLTNNAKILYSCDICNMKTFDRRLMLKHLIPVFYHEKMGDIKHDRYGWETMLLCPKCLDKLTFFKSDGHGGMIARERRLPNEGIKISDSEKAEWEIVKIE